MFRLNAQNSTAGTLRASLPAGKRRRRRAAAAYGDHLAMLALTAAAEAGRQRWQPSDPKTNIDITTANIRDLQG
jgi:hypothetical protein